jgi:hypothetical protein
MSELDAGDLGTPTSGTAVTTALADLRTSLERLQSTADDCVVATGRHLDDSDTADGSAGAVGSAGGDGSGAADGSDETGPA